MSAKYKAPALSKGLDIMELLAEETTAISLSEIAIKLERSKGEIFRMLLVLTERGYLHYDSRLEVYTLSPKIFQLAHRQSAITRLSALANPIMSELIHDTKQSCHLVMYYDGQCLVIAQHDSPQERFFKVRLGASIDILHSCSGHVLLAFADESSAVHISKQLNTKEQQLLRKKIFKEDLAKIRERGYEDMPSGQVHGVRDMGYPVFDYTGKVQAVMVVPYLERIDGNQSVTMDAAREKLRLAALKLSDGLGGSSFT